MTVIELQVLLHWYYLNIPFPYPMSPAFKDATRSLEREEMIV